MHVEAQDEGTGATRREGRQPAAQTDPEQGNGSKGAEGKNEKEGADATTDRDNERPRA